MEKLRMKKTNGLEKKNSVPILYTFKRGDTYEISTRKDRGNRADAAGSLNA